MNLECTLKASVGGELAQFLCLIGNSSYPTYSGRAVQQCTHTHTLDDQLSKSAFVLWWLCDWLWMALDPWRPAGVPGLVAANWASGAPRRCSVRPSGGAIHFPYNVLYIHIYTYIHMHRYIVYMYMAHTHLLHVTCVTIFTLHARLHYV